MSYLGVMLFINGEKGRERDNQDPNKSLRVELERVNQEDPKKVQPGNDWLWYIYFYSY